MKKIAITGGIASGKTAVAILFAAKNFPVFNCDDEVKKLYQNPKVLEKIKAQFPNSFTENTLNKTKLKQELTKNGLLKLEAILYPSLIKRMKQFTFANRIKGKKMAFFEVPLLLEKNWTPLFDDAIIIASTKRKRQRHFIARGGNPTVFSLLNNAQWGDAKKLAVATKNNFKIIPSVSLKQLQNQVEKILRVLL